MNACVGACVRACERASVDVWVQQDEEVKRSKQDLIDTIKAVAQADGDVALVVHAKKADSPELQDGQGWGHRSDVVRYHAWGEAIGP